MGNNGGQNLGERERQTVTGADWDALKSEQMAVDAAELATDVQELEHPLETVGEASGLQQAQYLADDQEDLESEAGKGYVGQIVVRSQEQAVEKILPELNKVINQKNYRPSELEEIYRKGRDATLAVFNRRIGDRNNAA